MSEAKTRLDRVYQSENPEQLRESYQAWAALYESDLVGKMGYDKPMRVGQAMVSTLKPASRILDVGCGTGLVGAYLHQQDFNDITGLDFAEEMLAQARKRNVYRALVAHDLAQALPWTDHHFDAVVGVGVFTEGHASPKCLAELVRVVRPGGQIFFSLRDDVYQSMSFDRYRQELVTQGRWELSERKQLSDGLEGRPWSIWIYKVL
jgi:predicted TPR repeat methyltransferase